MRVTCALVAIVLMGFLSSPASLAKSVVCDSGYVLSGDGRCIQRSSIWIQGKAVPLRGEAKVITFKEAPEWALKSHKVRRDSKRRRIPAQGGAEERRRLNEALTQIVLHTDLTKGPESVHRVLEERKLSEHFFINWDGTIYQWVDVARAALHAPGANQRSVGVTLNNLMPNLLSNSKETEKSIGRVEDLMTERGTKRPKSEVVEINRGKVQSYGYTKAQYRALRVLLETLTAELDIPVDYPRDADGRVSMMVLDEPAAFKGVVAHWHVTENRWDPGPGFTWSVIDAMAGAIKHLKCELGWHAEDGRCVKTSKVWIQGEAVPLRGEARLVTFKETPKWAMTGHKVRRDARRKRISAMGGPEERRRLNEAITQIVLHTDLTEGPEALHRVLRDREMSSHFFIHWDGTIYQWVDVARMALHAGEADARSVGIDLHNLMPNLAHKASGGSKRIMRAEQLMKERGTKRPISKLVNINGAEVQSYGYTDAQYRALKVLLKTLSAELNVPLKVPRRDDGSVITKVLKKKKRLSFQGIVAHWHLTGNRWDPGPGFDWSVVDAVK